MFIPVSVGCGEPHAAAARQDRMRVTFMLADSRGVSDVEGKVLDM